MSSKSLQDFPPGPAFWSIVRVRNLPPRVQVPQQSVQDDHEDSLQFRFGGRKSGGRNIDNKTEF